MNLDKLFCDYYDNIHQYNPIFMWGFFSPHTHHFYAHNRRNSVDMTFVVHFGEDVMWESVLGKSVNRFIDE